MSAKAGHCNEPGCIALGGHRTMPPLEPFDAQEAPVRRRNGSRTNRERVLKAMALLRPVAVSLGSRRPRGCFTSPLEADLMQRQVEDALAKLRSVSVVLDRAGRRG